MGETGETGKIAVLKPAARGFYVNRLESTTEGGCHQRENWEKRQGREHEVGVHVAMHPEGEDDSKSRKEEDSV